MIIAIYDDAGVSRIADLDFERDFGGAPGAPALFAASQWAMIEGRSGDTRKWHHGELPGLSVVIDGAWEIEAGDGERRVLGCGDVLLLLDTTGQGHRSRVTSTGPCRVLGVTCPQEVGGLLGKLVARAGRNPVDEGRNRNLEERS